MTLKPAYRSFTALPFTAVKIDDVFWAPKQRVNRERTLRIEYEQSRDTGRIDAFKLEWKPGNKPIPHIFWDSDVAKWIEAASYSLATHPDPELDAQLDEIIALIASAQQADGYLNTHFTQVEPEKRWTNLRDWHELYCAGHMIEAAVAHYQATGKTPLLDVVKRYADYIATVFGRGPGQKRGYPGHEEIELALVKLYHVTGGEAYLRLAQYFIDERGQRPHYYDQEARARGEDPAKFWARTYAYMQADQPVRELAEVAGHAVRAMYLYSAMADLAGETGDEGLNRALDRLWQDLTRHKLYLTGGLGPSRHNEGFTSDYDLPNETAYAETCAAVGLVFWAHRMLQLRCDRQYADVMERALYNGALAGVSLDGERFFYENPLASAGSHHRQAWFDCACCPPNIARLIASLGQYFYSYNEREIAVHLYAQGSAAFHLNGAPVTLSQETNYPWDGNVKITVKLGKPGSLRFALRARIPGWCREVSASINGQEAPVTPLENGYWVIDREWTDGDAVTLEFAMPVERVYARPEVRADAGRAALVRGPLVYCLESADNATNPERIVLPRGAQFSPDFQPGLLGGVTALKGAALAASDDWGDALYRAKPPELQPVEVTAIPYFAWDNRDPGPMEVWLIEE